MKKLRFKELCQDKNTGMYYKKGDVVEFEDARASEIMQHNVAELIEKRLSLLLKKKKLKQLKNRKKKQKKLKQLKSQKKKNQKEEESQKQNKINSIQL